jgi:hypothetical protein
MFLPTHANPDENGHTSPAVVMGPRASAPDRARNVLRVVGLTEPTVPFSTPTLYIAEQGADKGAVRWYR